MLIEPAIDDVEKGRQGVLLSRSSPQWLPNLCPEQEAGNREAGTGGREGRRGQGRRIRREGTGNKDKGTEKQEQKAGREGGGIVYC